LRSQEVLALGYPLGQSKLKSTLGIVSGRERLGYFGYIQITAPINPGNSGGPALNTAGKVIGINSRGIVEAQNVGYIIPINEVRSALDDLYAVKLLRKPTLGCLFTMATPEIVKYLKNPVEGGWYVAKVFDNTLLKSVGVESEDMLYEVNGYKVDLYGELNVPWSEDKASLFELLNRHKVGDMLHFVVYRKGARKEFTFKLEHKFLPAIRTIYPEFEPEFMDYEVLGGMVVMPLTLNHIGLFLSNIPALVKYGQAEYQQDPCLIITHVLPNSQAHKARVISPGSLIEKVNNVKVRTMKELREAVKLSKESGYITLCTTNNLYAVLPVDKILADEYKLSNLYFYKPSSLLEYLKK
jgi:serine protease Do